VKHVMPDIAALARTIAELKKDAVSARWPDPPAGTRPPLPARCMHEADINEHALPYGQDAERLRVLQEAAPDIAVLCDEEPWTWTAIVPSLSGEDDSKLSAATLTDLLPQLEHVLGRREEARRTSIRGSLDVLRMSWSDVFEIGWDGQWWYRRRDGRGETVTAPTPEELIRLMAQDYREQPIRLIGDGNAAGRCAPGLPSEDG
jgi:hypothetical protein